MGKSTRNKPDTTKEPTTSTEPEVEPISTPTPPKAQPKPKSKPVSVAAYLKSVDMNTPANIRFLEKIYKGAKHPPETWKELVHSILNRKTN